MLWSASVLLLASTLLVARGGADVDEQDCGDCCKIGFEDCPEKKCSTGGEDKVVVCYFVDWAYLWRYAPESIPYKLCTHISYAFAVLDKTSLTVKPYDPEADIDKGWYDKVVALKNHGLKVLLSVGGSQDVNEGDKWARMLESATARASFVQSAVALLDAHKFDGLELHFGEYNMHSETKGCPLGNRVAANKDQLTQLLTELKEAFKGKQYLLTLAASASKECIDECFDMPKLCGLVDWVSIIAYNYHHWSEKKIGAQAPFCGVSDNDWGVYDTVKYYVESVQCPASKVVLGVPLYGQTFTLPAPGQGWGAPVTEPGKPGDVTKYKSGQIAYHETCMLVKSSGYKEGFSKVHGSYACSDDQFISFDNVQDMKRKACLINKFDLKGVSVWELDFDDWEGACGGGANPLLTALNQGLRCP